jgi:uncharacterized protein
MKKTIIIFGLALMGFANVSFASNVSKFNNKEVVFYGKTPLTVAVVKGDLAIIKKFIEYGADVNESADGVTPLMLAARYNNVQVVKLLIENGADIDTKDYKGFNALKYAQLSNAIDVLELLKK